MKRKRLFLIFLLSFLLFFSFFFCSVMKSGNTFGNPILSYNASIFISPFLNYLQTNGIYMTNNPVPIFDNLFLDPLQRNNLMLNSNYMTDAIMPVFSMSSQIEKSESNVEKTKAEESEVSAIATKENLAEEVMALANTLTQYVLMKH